MPLNLSPLADLLQPLLRQCTHSNAAVQVYKGAEHPHNAQKPVDITHMINKKVYIPPKIKTSAELIEAAKSQ